MPRLALLTIGSLLLASCNALLGLQAADSSDGSGGSGATASSVTIGSMSASIATGTATGTTTSTATATATSASSSTGGQSTCGGTCIAASPAMWTPGARYDTPGNCSGEQTLYVCDAASCTCGSTPGACDVFDAQLWNNNTACAGVPTSDNVRMAGFVIDLCNNPIDVIGTSYKCTPEVTANGSCVAAPGTKPSYFCAAEDLGCAAGMVCAPSGGQECVIATSPDQQVCPAAYAKAGTFYVDGSASCCACVVSGEKCTDTNGDLYEDCGSPSSTPLFIDGLCHASPAIMLAREVFPSGVPSKVTCSASSAPQTSGDLLVCCK